MADSTSFGRYTISTLCEKRRYGIRGIAYCPICDRAEESDYPDNSALQAITISLGKVRIHMRLIHRIKDNPDGHAML